MTPTQDLEPVDELGAYLETIPPSLSANKWGRWRAKHRPLYFLLENRWGGKCGLCGGELSAWLELCPACMERELAYVRALPPEPRKPRPVPGIEGRTLREEWVDYPEQGPYRPADRKLWFVVEDAAGLEVTRSLKREVAETYL